MTAPLPFLWDGEAMIPRHPRAADRAYTVGETYLLEPHHERSAASHRHYFAQVRDLFLTLPEHLEGRWIDADHLRKEALIRTGHCDSATFVESSNKQAQKLAAFLRPIDSYAIVVVSGCTVTRYVARSQDMRSMDRAMFQKSKDDVLGYIADLLGVEPATLARAA